MSRITLKPGDLFILFVAVILLLLAIYSHP